MLRYKFRYLTNIILQYIKKNRIYSIKIIKKLGLIPAMMQARFEFALRYKKWMIEDWKNVGKSKTAFFLTPGAPG